VNAASSETGRRFRFKQISVGDYTLGYADAAEFKVAEAMAVSAAYPGYIGPFVIETGRYEWRKRETWGSSKDDARITQITSDKLHLYDGGIYDNLGTEPLFDSGKQCFKEGVDYIIVSDAGAPLGQVNSRGFQPFRLMRVTDIISEQSRALRVRSFVNFLQCNPRNGAYIQIGADAQRTMRTYSKLNPEGAERLLRDSWVSTEDAARSAAYPTTLWRMSVADFDLLSRHGYETAKWNLQLFT
jgi:NTE family protein